MPELSCFNAIKINSCRYRFSVVICSIPFYKLLSWRLKGIDGLSNYSPHQIINGQWDKCVPWNIITNDCLWIKWIREILKQIEIFWYNPIFWFLFTSICSSKSNSPVQYLMFPLIRLCFYVAASYPIPFDSTTRWGVYTSKSQKEHYQT